MSLGDGILDWLSPPSEALGTATVAEGVQEEEKSFHRHESVPRSSVFQHMAKRILALRAVCSRSLVRGVVTDPYER
jgi:hypothetical protein